ncbi:guanine-1-methyltransferase-domain-containing protein [Irpex rosettiformis]|uniref:Guanine-1-methyltransferase-domain-containing protein n=1 Tax=Irpex rosettiformis TaxID=378272 RepID=A0ACB8U4V2_9APHY|nr:guanine-1-methyltransferase-domain-containing protein [Irpex rosettiformis]
MDDIQTTPGTSNAPLEQPTTSVGPDDQMQPQPLSKNAQKKLARAARIAEQKKERRAYEKEKKKEKKRQLAAKRAAGELEEDEEGGARKKAKTDLGPRVPFKARIVVDLGFDDLMSENEIKSLTSQLAFTYSANRKAVQPFESVVFTSLEKRTYTRLESIGDAAYRRWHDTEWWEESYERLWTGKLNETAEHKESVVEERKEGEEEGETKTSTPISYQSAAQETVVYLTADSNDELSELREGETYIIGGICDHNRYKNLCLNKSKESGIRSARLPIGTYLAELKTRKVLTVNQTFEILLKWVETRDWKKALEEVVPKRKFNETGRNRGGNKSENTDEQQEQEGCGEEEAHTVIVDATALEGDEEDGDADIPDTLDPTQDESRVNMDNAHPEVPS